MDLTSFQTNRIIPLFVLVCGTLSETSSYVWFRKALAAQSVGRRMDGTEVRGLNSVAGNLALGCRGNHRVKYDDWSSFVIKDGVTLGQNGPERMRQTRRSILVEKTAEQEVLQTQGCPSFFNQTTNVPGQQCH
ncbi:hypothetical protein RRG08_061202 [Elysia crispata]|uniref:Uncharacterized protein n=1 Tax=Elysia crispata TaxID=231223 RepID=A0AAE0ZMD6_9GAST|nr:hypothetical protein RRG08_061202 [Elysia crispata]